MATSTPSQNSPAGKKGPPPPEAESATVTAPIAFGTLRAVLLILFLMLGNYWLHIHLGVVGFDSPSIAYAAAGLAGALALIDALFGEKWKNNYIRATASVLLDLRVLIVLWAALLLESLIFSSVTIVGNSTAESLRASLISVEAREQQERKADNKDDQKNPVHFYRVPTTPVGKSYRLSVAGYLPRVIQVYPILETTIVPSRDLQVSPSILFRPPELTLGPMEGKVRVEAYVTKDKKRTQIARDDQVGAQSILVGYKRSVPVAYIESWRMELMAQGIKDESEIAKILHDWKTPHFLDLKEAQLEPNTNLELIVHSPSGDILASANVLLTSDELQDVVLERKSGNP